jgi:hypothetical protein
VGLILLRVLVAIAVRLRGIGELPLAIGDVLRLILERLHRALERGALEHLGALLQLLAESLLHGGEILHCLTSLIAGELLRGVFEFHLSP